MTIVLLIILIILMLIAVAVLINNTLKLNEFHNCEVKYNEKLNDRLQEETKLNASLSLSYNKLAHKQQKLEENFIKILGRKK